MSYLFQSDKSFRSYSLPALMAILLTQLLLGCAGAPPADRLLSGAQSPPSDPAGDLAGDVAYLASDELGGRGLGSPGLDLALQYVARRFQSLGLQPPAPGGESRDGIGAYLQEFSAHGRAATANVIGVLPGDPAVSPQAVVIGAHIDHLGTDPSLTGDQIYNGAEDNASGVAALLDVARQLVQWRTGLDDHERSGLRSVIFIVFSAEESGLLGSNHYAANPAFAHTETIAMINLDSVGRLRDNQLYLFGTGSAREFPAIIEGLNQAPNFTLTTQAHGVGGSDHVSFLHQQVPALHLFTGPHTDYHKVTDEAAGVSIDGLAQVADFAGELVRYLSYRLRPLTFVAAEKKPATPPMGDPGSGGGRRASAGFMPDFSRESGGVKVGRVTPGGAADTAGLKEGDIIVALDDESTDTLADYSALLRSHAPGDEVKLSLQRGAEKLDLNIVLQAR